MNDAARLVAFPAIVTAAVFLSLRWPDCMRRASRFLAVANGAALLCIIATGCMHLQGPFAMIHRWLPHILLIADWSAIPLAIGVTLALSRGRPIAAATRALGLLVLLGVIFLASITGYLGPSIGRPIDAMSLRRFQVIHYWVWPSLAISPVIWWYYSLGPQDEGHRAGGSLRRSAAARREGVASGEIRQIHREGEDNGGSDPGGDPRQDDRT